MYSKFNYSPSVYFYNNNLKKFFKAGMCLYEHSQQETKKQLKNFILESGKIDGSKLRDNWLTL